MKKEKLPEHYTKQDIIDLLTVSTRAIERAIVVLSNSREYPHFLSGG